MGEEDIKVIITYTLTESMSGLVGWVSGSVKGSVETEGHSWFTKEL